MRWKNLLITPLFYQYYKRYERYERYERNPRLTFSLSCNTISQSMANKQSALKELRKTKKRTAHNSRIKTNVKQLFRQCMDLIQAGDMENAKLKAKEFQQTADKAAKRHIISQNRAARKKSALMAVLSGKRPIEVKLAHGKKKISQVKKATTTKPEVTIEAEPNTTETTNNEA